MRSWPLCNRDQQPSGLAGRDPHELYISLCDRSHTRQDPCVLVTSVGLSAKTIKFPEADPAFSFTLPEGWTSSVDSKGSLDCVAGNGSKYIFSVVDAEALPELSTEAPVKGYLPKLAKTMGDAANITNLKVSDVQEMTTEKKVKVFGLDGKGTASGVEMDISLGGFASDEGHYFIVMGVNSAEADNAHGKEMNEIFSSITPEADGDDK